MTNRRRNSLIILVLLLIAALLLWFLLRPKAVQDQIPVETTIPSEPLPVVEKQQVAPLTIREAPTQAQATVEAVARSFSERYASFSAESKFANIRDLFPIMTDRFRSEQEAMISSAGTSNEYYGVSSKVLSLNSVSLDESEATIEASLQRTIAIGSASNSSVSVEVLRVELKKVGGEWLVSDAQWLE